MGDASNPDWTSQWQAAARPWLDAWKDFAQGAAAPAAPARPEGFEQWARLFTGAGPQGETIERMVDAAKNQAAFMQSMLGALSAAPGGGTNWAEALRGSLAKPAMFDHPMAQVWRDGGEQARQFLARFMRVPDMPATPAAATDAWGAMFDLPAFGPMREHQERYQRSGRAWLEYRKQLDRYNKLMLDAAQRGFAHFERKLADREQPGRQIESLRALYDLWVDAAEEGYAEVALSPEFRAAYGDLVNAQMRVRAQMQGEVERMSRELGMPTRSEVNSIGQRLQALRREVRADGTAAQLAGEVAALRRQVADLKAAQAAASRATVTQAQRADDEADAAQETVLRKEASPRKRPSPARAERKPAAKTARRDAPASAAGDFASRIGKYAESSLGASRSKPAKKAAATKGTAAAKGKAAARGKAAVTKGKAAPGKRASRRTDKGNA
ncbi:class III poly(R)-hydroxyalkanoic acid synthase subunit PhaE [Dokdonella sp.]|uniref:class III poly(R)-hydroxyalkanoic acid synthase subunit PhaE n=1 Tax=Dokdonella sp. TaxID=2291710 RepID=UPI0031C2A960|nr:class III poly(R)-hydroxyalkanoic acid synthase subunit PhaE [Dokdonella sp.]